MTETDDETSFRNVWDSNKELMFIASTIRAMPKWNQENNDKKIRSLIREILDKSSGGNIAGMLSSVLTDHERQELVRNEQLSQEVLDSLHLKEDTASQGVQECTRSQSPSLLENFERDHEKELCNQIDIKYGLGPLHSRIETTWGGFGDSQGSNPSLENRIEEINDQEADSGASSEVDSNASTQIDNQRNYDPDLGDNNFSDESDIEVPAITSKPSCSSDVSSLTPINKVLRQRRPRKNADKATRIQKILMESSSSSLSQMIEKSSTQTSEYEPDTNSLKSTSTEDSFESQEVVEKTPKKKRRVNAPKASTPIPVIDILEGDDDIPNVEQENAAENDKENDKVINVLRPSQINKKFRQEDRNNPNNLDEEIIVLSEQSSTQSTKSKKCSKGPKKGGCKNAAKRILFENEEVETLVEAVENPDEIVVEPDQTNGIFENPTHSVEPETPRKSRKPRPGKESLLDHLRTMLRADENVTDEEIFQAFKLKKTLFSASGYAPEHMCVCKKPVKEEIPNQFMFELESNIASGQDGNGDRVTICPRCFLIYSDGGKDQKRKTFLKMVYELHLGIEATFIRCDGPNKRVFQLQSSKKWMKDIKKSQVLSKFECFKVKQGKIYIELLPCANSNAIFVKNNPGDKVKIFLKVKAFNRNASFHLRDIETQEKNTSGSLQLSLTDCGFSKIKTS